MSLAIYVIENKANKDIDSLCETYLKRIKNYHKVVLHKLPAARVKDPEAQKIKESDSIEAKVKPGDTLILCDELGKEFTSKQFSHYLEKEFSQLRGRVIFAIGGAYGFTEELKKKHTSIKLSQFVFPHHLARLVLVEQIYRAISIQRNMPYHHE